MKKLLIGLILILLAGAGAYAYFKYTKTEDKPTVTQAAFTQGNIIQQVQATGTLEAIRNVQVGSQVSGTVKAIYVDFNSIVKKDQVIAELDPSLLQVQVAVQKANIERQQGDIAQQQVQLENDQLNLKRSVAQAEKGLVSPQQREAAELAVKSRMAQIESAKKQIVQSQAQLSQAELNVSYCTIRSPIDGVVVNRAADVGQTVQSSMQVATLFLIATDLRTLKLSAGVDEADIGFIRRGMPVSFQVDSYQGQNFTGTVDAVRLNAQTANNVVTYPVWITVDNSDLKLRPSMTANLRIIVDQANNVLKVPNQALRFRPTGDMYTWLGLTPPAAGRGRGAGANADAGKGVPGAPGDAAGKGGRDAAGKGQPGGTASAGGGRRQRGGQGAPGGDQTASLREGGGQGRGQGRQDQGFNAEAGQGGGRRGQGGEDRGGFGRGGSTLTPEQMAQFREQFGGRGGRGGRGQGGQPGQGGGGRGQGAPGGMGRAVGNAPQLSTSTITSSSAEKIDDLFSEVPKRIQPGQVWLYDEKATDPAKKLRQISVRLGLTDGSTSELVSSGEPLAVGTMVVTNVVPPPSAMPKAGGSSIFQQQRGFGPGGGDPRFSGPQPGGGMPSGGGGGTRGGGGGRGGN